MSSIVDTDGVLTYEGHTVAVNASGEPCVFTTGGWMAIVAFERFGLDVSNLDAARARLEAAGAGAAVLGRWARRTDERIVRNFERGPL